MTSQIGSEKVIQVRCSQTLWRTLGWRQDVHPCELLQDQLTSLVTTPWDYERQSLKYLLVCGPSPTRPVRR